METPKHPKSELPYIYTDEELKRIFEYAGSDSLHTTSLYPGTLKYVLHMTYVMGLRISETLSLRVSNVNMKESYIEIIDSKRHKSRLVPFNRQVYRLITKRMRWRVLPGMANDPDTPFWLNKRGIQLTASTIKKHYAKIRIALDIRRTDGERMKPRIHDLRHTIAVRRLTQWYQEGVECTGSAAHTIDLSWT